MISKSEFDRFRLLFVLIVSLLLLSTIVWDYFHEGVPSHHFLADEDLPQVSNWWGLLTIPLASFYLLKRVRKRVDFSGINPTRMRIFLLPFGVSFLYGVCLALAFTVGREDVSGILFQLIFLIALFFPIYRSEYILGFILGLTYFFGGVLPVMISAIIATISYLIFSYIRALILFFLRKTGIFSQRNLSL